MRSNAADYDRSKNKRRNVSKPKGNGHEAEESHTNDLSQTQRAVPTVRMIQHECRHRRSWCYDDHRKQGNGRFHSRSIPVQDIDSSKLGTTNHFEKVVLMNWNRAILFNRKEHRDRKSQGRRMRAARRIWAGWRAWRAVASWIWWRQLVPGAATMASADRERMAGKRTRPPTCMET